MDKGYKSGMIVQQFVGREVGFGGLVRMAERWTAVDEWFPSARGDFGLGQGLFALVWQPIQFFIAVLVRILWFQLISEFRLKNCCTGGYVGCTIGNMSHTTYVHW